MKKVMNAKLITLFLLVFTFISAPSYADNPSAEVWLTDRTISRVEVSWDTNLIWIYTDQGETLTKYMGYDDTKLALLMKVEMIHRTLLSAFLSGNKVSLFFKGGDMVRVQLKK